MNKSHFSHGPAAVPLPQKRAIAVEHAAPARRISHRPQIGCRQPTWRPSI